MATQKKRFKLFDTQREGLGISKIEKTDPKSLKRFFILLKDNIGKLVSLNILFVIGNIPLIFLIMTLSGYTKNEGLLPFYDVFQNINAIAELEGTSPSIISLLSTYGVMNRVLVNTPLTYVFYGLSALTLLTFGCVNAGTAYILRNIVKGDPVFIWTDFWYAVRRNWRQALPFGILDGAVHAILLVNIVTNITSASFINSVFFWMSIVILILFYFMRPYIYVQMVTFKLTVFKMIKNALIFALAGFKRNFMSLLGGAFILLFEVLFLFSFSGILLPIAIALPLALMFALMAFMKVFASYYKIKELIIDPYYAEHPEELPEEPSDDAVMSDDVTERERLESIKKARNI